MCRSRSCARSATLAGLRRSSIHTIPVASLWCSRSARVTALGPLYGLLVRPLSWSLALMEIADRGLINGRMRDELLNETLFFDLDDARAKIANWVADYNLRRPHSSLKYLPPRPMPPTSFSQGRQQRPPLLRKSGARKFVVAVAGRQCVLLSVRYAPTTTKFPHRRERTRWAGNGHTLECSDGRRYQRGCAASPRAFALTGHMKEPNPLCA